MGTWLALPTGSWSPPAVSSARHHRRGKPLGHAALGPAGVQRQLHGHRPAAVAVAGHEPVRLDGGRLVNQFEPALALADGLDREGPKTRWPRGRQANVDAQPLVAKAEALALAQIELRAKLSQAVAVQVVEVAVVGARGQAGKVHLDGEVQRPVLWQILQQIGDLQRGAAGVERQALGDLHRHPAGPAVADQLYLDAVRVAANPGFVVGEREIAPHGGLARGHGGERCLVVVEEIQEALPRVLVVLDPLVEVGLLEDHAVVNAGAVAVALICAGQHLAVIGLRLPRERCQQVVLDAADVQFGKHAAAAGYDQGHQPVVGQANLLPGVEIVVVGRGLHPGLGAIGQAIEGFVGGDQAVVDRVAEVRQVNAAEGPVPMVFLSKSVQE